MQKSKATKLAKIINYFANEWQDEVWVADIFPYFEHEWQIEVRLKNSVYSHELNALMMVISNTVTPSVYQKVDDKDEIYWKIW